MGNEVNNVPQNNGYYQMLQQSGLSKDQLTRLDAINGQPGDGVIDEGVFKIADSIINKVQLQGEIAQNSALVQEVQDVMRGIDISEIVEEYNATPMKGLTPETLKKGLNLRDDQINEIIKLSAESTGDESVLDRGIASIVICLVRGQEPPANAPKALISTICGILGRPQAAEAVDANSQMDKEQGKENQEGFGL